jgi:hypothetical protein
LRASFPDIRHDFIPSWVNLVGGRDQDGVRLAAAQYPETLPPFHLVEQGASLLMQFFRRYGGHVRNRHQNGVTVNNSSTEIVFLYSGTESPDFTGIFRGAARENS